MKKILLLTLFATAASPKPAAAKCTCYRLGKNIVCRKEEMKQPPKKQAGMLKQAKEELAELVNEAKAQSSARDSKVENKLTSCHPPIVSEVPQLKLGLGLTVGMGASNGLKDPIGWGLVTGSLSIRFADNKFAAELRLGAGISPTSDMLKQTGGVALGGGLAVMAQVADWASVGLGSEILTDVWATGLNRWDLLFGPKLEFLSDLIEPLGEKHMSFYLFVGVGPGGEAETPRQLHATVGGTMGFIFHTR